MVLVWYALCVIWFTYIIYSAELCLLIQITRMWFHDIEVWIALKSAEIRDIDQIIVSDKLCRFLWQSIYAALAIVKRIQWLPTFGRLHNRWTSSTKNTSNISCIQVARWTIALCWYAGYLVITTFHFIYHPFIFGRSGLFYDCVICTTQHLLEFLITL